MNDDLTDAERRAVEAARTAHAIIGGDPLAPYDVIGLAREIGRLKTLWEECEKDNKQLEAEVEKLRRDNDLLREALRNG